MDSNNEPAGGLDVPVSIAPRGPRAAPALYIRDAVFIQLLTVVLMLAGGAILGFMLAVRGIDRAYLESPAGQGAFQIVTYIAVSFGTAGLVWFFARIRGVSAGDLGLKPAAMRYFGIALLCFGCMLVLLGYLESWLDEEATDAMAKMTRDMLPKDGMPPLVIFLFVALLVPFAEELFFRGVLIGSLRQRMPLIWAALISMAVFAAFHLHYLFLLPGTAGAVAMAQIVALSAALTLPYYLSGSIWPSVALHVCWNGMVFVVPVLTALE